MVHRITVCPKGTLYHRKALINKVLLVFGEYNPRPHLVWIRTREVDEPLNGLFSDLYGMTSSEIRLTGLNGILSKREVDRLGKQRRMSDLILTIRELELMRPDELVENLAGINEIWIE